MPDATDAPLATWQKLSRLGRAGQQRIEAALAAEDLPPDEIHSLLDALSRTDPPHTPGTAKALESALDMPQYAVSRLLVRAERAGVISRRPHPSDRRSSLVTMTAEGRRLHPIMARTRGRAIADFLAAHLRPGQVRRLHDLLAKAGAG